MAPALVVTLGALAGCLGGDDSTSGGAAPVLLPPERERPGALNGTGPADLSQGTGAVTWSAGDWWTYAYATLQGGREVWRNVTAVVVDDAGPLVVGANSTETTRLDAFLVDLLPVGTVDADHNPTWRGQPFPMFRWPLAHGSTWTADAPLDGRTAPLAFAVGYDAGIATPFGARPGFRVSAVDNGTLRYAYDYAPAAGWFTLFEEFDKSGNRVRWYVLTAWGSDWAGEAYTLQAETLADRTLRYERPESPESVFAVRDGFDYLFVWLEGQERGVTYDQRVLLQAPNGQFPVSYSARAGGGGGFGFPNRWSYWQAVDADPGEWKLELLNLGAANLSARISGVVDVSHGAAPAAP